MKVVAKQKFDDKREKVRRYCGDVFEVSKERYEEIQKAGNYVELLAEGSNDEPAETPTEPVADEPAEVPAEPVADEKPAKKSRKKKAETK